MLIRDLEVKFVRQNVLRQIDCRRDSAFYEEIVTEYEEIKEQMYELCEPVFLLEKGTLGPEHGCEGIPENVQVFFALYSIGGKLSAYSTKCFEEGEYVKGMLADAMADDALFSLEKATEDYLKEACANCEMGIEKRLEAPKDIPMEMQKLILEKTKGEELCGIGISSGYMLNPVKSMAAIYVLTEKKEQWNYQHDCRTCGRIDCKLRKMTEIPVTVLDEGTTRTLLVRERENILDSLIASDHSVSAVCGGSGRCGKCKIKVLEGFLPITDADRACLTEAELSEGVRLSCQAYPTEPLQIALQFKTEDQFCVLSDYEQENHLPSGNLKIPGIAIDIGTTTIVVQMLNSVTGERLAAYTAVNPQRKYGADVISRIMASTNGKGKELQKMLQKELVKGIGQVIAKADVMPEEIKEIVISGNTTMIHLLVGYDCRSLGVYPFTPVTVAPINDSYQNIMEDDSLNVRGYILPGISTFVGGDVVAGLYTCDIHQQKEYCLLIDLGTNGEIALGNQEKIMVTSTAAGPAFEGGNIKFGVGSIEGAICGVTINEQGTQIGTIGGKEPVGICGTGVIETVAELLEVGYLDETGCLEDEFFEEGFPLGNTGDGTKLFLTQADIREVQLAKAAIRAGIETLCLRYGIDKTQIGKVYLAGGFGYRLDCRKAIRIGMLPECFEGKIEAVGNTSLAGAAKILMSAADKACLEFIASNAEEINLSADKEFQNFYMDAMYFDDKTLKSCYCIENPVQI